MVEKTYTITGMHCASCAGNVEKAVNKLKNVKNSSVNLIAEKLKVEGNFSDDEIVDAISNAGDFKVIIEDNTS